MAETEIDHDHAVAHDEHGHGEIHLPPNSFIPLFIALSLMITFVGFLDGVRDLAGPAVWIAGLALFVGTCAVWLKAARSEYVDLPESGSH